MCKNKKQTEQITQLQEGYPRFLGTQPQGEDLFVGKSQERLAGAIAMHMTDVDKEEKPILSRLIGLEGKWGSGKSNLIKILQKKLGNTYTFFCFDAWGNQEDLQRRSILELLTKHLIDEKKLVGETSMRVLNADSNGRVLEEKCTWSQKLESLLSRKSYSREISVPSFNCWAKTFVLMLLVTGLLIPLIDLITKEDFYWWAKLSITVGPILVFLLIALFSGNLKTMWRMYNTEGRSDTTSYVISEQEPSVREFKDWMKEISEGIPSEEKLVLVFDNMDRLPSEKVHQFWSLIQTFFADADNGYKNIWCIVPYDESHLASVFSNQKVDARSIDLLRGFLNKTFPLIYRVPEPIVTDYRKVFESLFRQAFCDSVDEDSLELIGRCYRLTHPEPNVRDVITFINNNVLLAKQWGNTIGPVTRAVYLLKANSILVKFPLEPNNDNDPKGIDTADEYILANKYYKEFEQILFGKIDPSAMQCELAALVYGVDPDDAFQIVVKRYIRNCISEVNKAASLVKYYDNPYFMLLLQEDVKSMEEAEYIKAVPLIDEIDREKLNNEDKQLLDGIWRFFAERFIALEVPIREYNKYEHLIFSHVPADLARQCVKVFCERIISNEDVLGDHLYDQLVTLFDDEFARVFEVGQVCPHCKIESKRFADYVKRAGPDYQRFPITTNSDELNEAIEQTIDKDFPYVDVLSLLKGDEHYAVSEVGNFAVQQLNLKQADALLAEKLISIQRVFYSSYQSVRDANYFQSLWREVQTNDSQAAYDEIYALRTSRSFDALPDDERHINILLEKALFYDSTSQLLQHYLSGPNVGFRRNLLKRMMSEKKHDSNPVFPDFVENWQGLVNGLGVERKVVVLFADSWGYKSLSEQELAKPFFTLLSNPVWIDDLLAVDTPLSKELLGKCVEELTKQDAGQFVQPNTANHKNTNWNQALQKLINSPYLDASNLGSLTTLAVQLLDFVAKNSSFDDPVWIKLLEKVDYASISAQFVEIRNQILSGKNGYSMTPGKFQQLHGWLEQSEINTPDHCSDAANQILAKVIDNPNCQEIILAKKSYYSPIIANTLRTASVLHEKLKAILKNHGETEFASYIRSIVDYD